MDQGLTRTYLVEGVIDLLSPFRHVEDPVFRQKKDYLDHPIVQGLFWQPINPPDKKIVAIQNSHVRLTIENPMQVTSGFAWTMPEQKRDKTGT
ncbi:MAG: hypothetical protein Devi2KO_25720 [Devosia indica]